jgi:hypothetical protein
MALVQMSDFLENELLDHAFNNSVYTAPTSVYIALFTSNVGLEVNTQTNEVSGANYSRLEVGGASGRSFTVAATRGSENNEDWVFPAAGVGGWGTVVAMAVCDSSTGGQILMYSDLTVSRTINQNDTPTFSAGEIRFFFNESPSQISDYLAHELLDHVLRNSAYTPVATIYVGLWTADDGLVSNTQTSEVGAGVGYARATSTFTTASGGLVDNDIDVDFGPNTNTNWGTLTHVAVLDAASAGNVLMTVALDSTIAVIINDTVRFSVGALDLLLD